MRSQLLYWLDLKKPWVYKAGQTPKLTASSPCTHKASLLFLIHAAKFTPEFNPISLASKCSRNTEKDSEYAWLLGSPRIVPALTSISGGNNTCQALEIFQNNFEAKLCSRLQKSWSPREATGPGALLTSKVHAKWTHGRPRCLRPHLQPLSSTGSLCSPRESTHLCSGLGSSSALSVFVQVSMG